MLNRRSFLVSAGAGLAAGSMMSRFAIANQSRQDPARHPALDGQSKRRKDLEARCARCTRPGFREIEFAGFYDKSAGRDRQTREGHRPVAGQHACRRCRHRQQGRPDPRGREDARAQGSSSALAGRFAEKDKLPWEERMKAVDLNDWKWNADLFNKFGKQVSAAGMTFGYHNHSAEFKKYDGVTAFDYLYGHTDPKHVHIELDVGWVTVAQQDPIAILNKYKDRVIALHVKDVARRGADGKDPSSVALGEGVIDWKKVIGTAKANGTKAFFYEQEEPFTRPILDSVKISGDYLSKLAV
jgi:hypothetical protein